MSNSSLNATKHGCCAVDSHLLPGESEKDLKNIERIWNEAYQPKNDYHKKLVAELVTADWLLHRTTRNYLEIESRLNQKSTNPLDWSQDEQRTLGRFLRYRTAHANIVNRCRKAIEDYRKARAAEKIKQEKQEKAEQKANPMANWEQHLENMRQQAIALGYTPPES